MVSNQDDQIGVQAKEQLKGLYKELFVDDLGRANREYVEKVDESIKEVKEQMVRKILLNLGRISEDIGECIEGNSSGFNDLSTSIVELKEDISNIGQDIEITHKNSEQCISNVEGKILKEIHRGIDSNTEHLKAIEVSIMENIELKSKDLNTALYDNQEVSTRKIIDEIKKSEEKIIVQCDDRVHMLQECLEERVDKEVSDLKEDMRESLENMKYYYQHKHRWLIGLLSVQSILILGTILTLLIKL